MCLENEVLPDAVNWLLPSVVGLFFPPLTGGENICKEQYGYKPMSKCLHWTLVHMYTCIMVSLFCDSITIYNNHCPMSLS